MDLSQDTVLQEINRQMLALQKQHHEYLLAKLPSLPVKLKGYKHGTKEVIAEIKGDFRLDYLYEAVGDQNVAVQYLLDGRDRAEVNKISRELGRVFFVIDCGTTEAPVTPSPDAPNDPDPEPICA